jgi:phospholipid/cholesterol/gamma-HCH transport system substrate-binding protein
MTTSKRTSDFVVGITVLVVTVMLVGTVLWLKQADLGNRTRHLTVRAREVGGVSLGNPVVIRGVRSGRVEGITLGEQGWVVLSLGLDPDVVMPSDPVVLLAASSLFGEWQATVTETTGLPPDRDLRAAIAEARTTGDTLAGAVLPDMAQLTAIAGRLAGDVARVTERVQVAFDDDAAKELRNTIRNMAVLSNELARTVQLQSKRFDKITTDVQTGLTTVNAASVRLNAFSARVDSATSKGEVQQLMVNAQAATREMVAATTRLRELADQLERMQGQVSTVVSKADTLVTKANSRDGTVGLMLNDPGLYMQGDSLVRELRALVADVKKNPKRYINVKVF